MSCRFLKVHIFGSNFSLKLSLKEETVIVSIKTLKTYCKATLNEVLNGKNFIMTN